MPNILFSNKIVYPLIAVVTILLTSCGYTRLAQTEERPLKRAPMPDLAIENISTSERLTQTWFMLNGPPRDVIEVTIEVCVRNIGLTPFKGMLLVSWKEEEGALEYGGYGHRSETKNCTLAVDDSIIFKSTASYSVHQKSMLADMVIITDQRLLPENSPSDVRIGAFPVEEERYDNNRKLFEVLADTLANE